MTRNIYTLLFALFAWSYGLQAQSYIMDGTPITDCGGFFLDSGGGNDNYGPNENFVTTICPDGGTSGTHIQLIFPGVSLAPGDLICFFDGPTTASPSLSCNPDFTANAPFIIQATAANVGGCVTVSFTSDGSGEDLGWSADINCVPACQTIVANLAMTDPAVMPADTGWIDICPGEGVFFEGTGSYPQDGIVYNHSDLTSSFSWSFGDGTSSAGPTAFHVFDEPGGYIVQMEIEDQFGCKNSNFINQRVRVAPYPTYAFADIPEICVGDSIDLSVSIAAIDSTSDLSVTPNSGSFQTTGVLSDSLFLPDGPNDPCYETSIFFSDFSPGQVLTDIDDFLSICVLMEHSFMGDLEIYLTCPDGTEVMLQDQGGGGTYLGEPIDNDLDLNPGVGYLYCWTPTATNGTWTDESAGVSTLPSGDYSTFEPLDGFLGCPLNGEWTIRICDLLSIDNGYIFEWSINLAEDLYPAVEVFTPVIADWGWGDNPSIYDTAINEDTISISPENAGTANYEFYVTYDTGCTFDTILNVPVLPETHPNCYSCGDEELNTLSDTSLCEGEFLMLDGAIPVSLGNQDVTFEAYSNLPFDNNTFPNANPLISTTTVNSINPGTVVDATLQIESVCVDVTHGFDSDVELYLRAPNGAILELSTDNGGTGNNYTNTCFTPDAAIAITAGAPPFTGDFQPEGIWGVLDGTPLNGDWSLLVSDDQNGGAGTFIGWSITFTNENEISYTWAPSPDLSCLDCPDPEVTFSQTSTYTLQTEDSFGCILNDTVEVQLLAALEAPDVTCQILPTDDIQFDWLGVGGAGGYEISLDNGATWITPNGTLSHIVTGLSPGQTVDILVRATSLTGCNALTANSSCQLTACNMTIDTSFTVAPTCFNTDDGFVFMQSTGATAPVEFTIDGSSPGGATIQQVAPGMHTVVAMDADGCLDSITFELLAPAAVTATLTVDPVDCAGEASGGATVTGDGGVGGFNYVWNTVPTTNDAVLDNALPGTYMVTISDANNCSITEEAVVPDVDPIVLTMTSSPSNCNGSASGSATVTPIGGTGSYSFLWSNGQITPTANNLMAGTYEVTVTDINDCVAIDDITVAEPAIITLTFDTEPAACFGESSGSATAVLTNAVEPIVYVWTNGNGTVTNSNISAGNYCVTITDANNCMLSDCVDITEPTGMIVDGTSTPALCVNGNEGTATVMASGGSGGFTYVWPDGQFTQTAINLEAGDYIVTVTDNTLCQQTLSINVGDAPAITLQIDSSPTSCSNTTDGDATVMASGGSGTTFAYLWDVNAGSQTNAVATNLLPGDYCVTVTDDNLCSEIACIAVDSPPAVVISDPVATAVNCFGNNDGQAEVTVSGGAGTGYNFLWNDPNAQFSNPANMLSAGIYTVTVSDINGCTAQETIEVTQPDELLATATSTAINCFGDTDGTASASQIGGTAPYNYVWSNGQTTEIAVNLSAGQQTVTITDDNGCSATAMSTIVAPTVELTITADQTFVGCFDSNQSVALAAADGGTGAGTYSYEWSDGSPGAEASSLGSGGVAVTVSDANGCTAVQSLNITELPEMTVEIIDNEPTCFGLADGLLGAVPDGGLGAPDPINYDYNYSWSTGSNLDTTSNAVGGVVYFVTVTDAQGCSVVGSKFLNQPDQMTFDLTPVDVLCNGNENGTITVGNINNGEGPFTYTWDANANNQTTEIAENLSVGIYFVTLTDNLGCEATENAAIAEPTPLTLTFQSEDNACADVTIGSASVQANGGVGNYTYLWSNGETTSMVDDLGTGDIVVTITDGNDCSVNQLINISQPEALSGVVQTSTVTCAGDRDGTVMMSAIGGTEPYLYQFNEGDLNGTNSLVGIEEGNYPVLIQDVNGCQWESEAIVPGPPNLFINAGPDTTIVLGDQLQLDAYVANVIGEGQISWFAPYSGTLFCPADSSEICEQPLTITQNTITYEVYIVDENGCEARDEITIFVEKNRPIYVPTAFTPNGDAVNSTLFVHGDEAITIDLFRIYDRWGSMVFETRDFQANDGVTGWDGSFKGEILNPGVFVWYIEASYIDGHKENFKGQTTLIL